MTDTLNQQLGHNLKSLRQARQWSLDKTARETGVSKAMLGQIERGESSPTLATLWRIATGLQTSFSSLVSGAVPHTLMTESAPPDTQSVADASSVEVRTAFPFNPATGFEVMVLTLPPGGESLSEPHDTGVTEHIMVISGTLELLRDGQWHRVTQGESIRFRADQPHGYRNPGSQALVFHDIIHYA